MPEPVQENPLLKYIWKKVNRQNNNYMMAFTGPTGSGKSWAMLRTGEALDPGFSVQQVAFTGKRFIELASDDGYGKGSYFGFDESGVGQGAREWWKDGNIVFNYVMQTWRRDNKIAAFTLPSLDLLDKQSRGLLDAVLQFTNINRSEGWTEWRFQRIQKNPKTGKLYYKYPVIRGTKVKGFRVSTPSEDLVEKYEDRKKEFTEDLKETALETFSNSGDDGDRDPRDIAEEIIEEDEVEEYIGDNYGQKYIDKSKIELDFGIGGRKSKKVKKVLQEQVEPSAV